MIELPEATALAAQVADALTGRIVTGVEANHSPHKLMGFFGDPDGYADLLVGQRITGARGVAGHLQIEAGDLRIVLSDGANPRLHAPGSELPARHQLSVDLDDGSTLRVTVAMYGGIQVFHDGENENPYYLVALAKPSPLTDAFDAAWFTGLLTADDAPGLSAKAVLATGQRIPGLGNGVLQDVLWNAGIHPRRKVRSLSAEERTGMFDAVTGTLRRMAADGGRDTERDLFGRPGGYRTVLSRTTLELPCPRCGGRVVKEPYLGGAVYVCSGCQVP
jgi:formamidopyrimidine-DNA glycosylase